MAQDGHELRFRALRRIYQKQRISLLFLTSEIRHRIASNLGSGFFQRTRRWMIECKKQLWTDRRLQPVRGESATQHPLDARMRFSPPTRRRQGTTTLNWPLDTPRMWPIYARSYYSSKPEPSTRQPRRLLAWKRWSEIKSLSISMKRRAGFCNPTALPY